MGYYCLSLSLLAKRRAVVLGFIIALFFLLIPIKFPLSTSRWSISQFCTLSDEHHRVAGHNTKISNVMFFSWIISRTPNTNKSIPLNQTGLIDRHCLILRRSCAKHMYKLCHDLKMQNSTFYRKCLSNNDMCFYLIMFSKAMYTC